MKIWFGLRFGRAAATLVAIALAFSAADSAHAQLRIVTYNTTGSPYTGMDIVLRSIGEELRNGIAKPIDVLLLQETSRDAARTDTQAFVDLLNTMYSGQMYDGEAITFARGNTIGAVSFSEDTTQSIVYRVQTVDLLGDIAIGSVSGSTQPRQTLRYRLRPDGYDATADFYIYNGHYKASQDSPPSTTNQDRRNFEAITIRNDSNALGSAHAIYAGDMNLYTAGEPAFQTLLGAGNGKAIDPLGLTDPTPDADPSDAGNWSNNSAVAFAHTQSPCSSAIEGCGVGGGMDDRFDFQLITEEFDDGDGLDIIDGSYHSFGNNGVSYNTSINNATNTNAATGYAFTGVTSHTRSAILTALRNVTDHIPVVVDYQVPAILDAVAGAVPEAFNIGDVFNLDVSVHNAAKVLVALGADELDYSLTTAGSVSGSFLNQIDAALGGVNVHQVLFDTSTPGMKTGTITVQSTSQAAANALVNIPISYFVLAEALAGDFNGDGTVDAGDYTLWRNNLGDANELAINNNGDGGGVDASDYDHWKMHYGESLPEMGGGGLAGTNHAVPEPASWLLLVLGCCLSGRRFGTLRAWTRAK